MAPEINETVVTPEIRNVLEAVIQANEALMAQNQALQQLIKTTIAQSSGINNSKMIRPGSIAALDKADLTNAEIWEGIFGKSATSSEQFMKAFYQWSRPESIQQVLNTSATWTSWTYDAAFPNLSRFLKRNHRCHCQVDMDDLLSVGCNRNTTSYHESRTRVEALWEIVKDREAFPPIEGDNPAKRVSARLFKIIDLSPMVLTALLASTPQ
jgi:hypothetical protein